MGPIDCHQPKVEDQLELSGNINKIVRKTKNNIVKVNHEQKAEELSCFSLFCFCPISWEQHEQKRNFYTKKMTFREGEIEAAGEDC